ncbi:zinc-dependent alcohol dehydrogenase family protein [Paludisphaera mucosa]|uniref:Zinc-dependent alcohol dehydrogenase family protein n=1 Tax=Paludisphaera mucosa TaxID=3030827 RepID=A0ABT6F593_9BACT|nr:zinc-dependent alcohol dehydrogenase family protein [Paludisphaera mucosa]MDG3002724.1 zinc-dependent alcohol dehydrogenase family protein [Paludisphaera mucosa]
MKAAVFLSFGDPSEVLKVQDVPTPEPGPGEVRVRMIASPVNPSDTMVVEGRYGVLPKLPATPGFEGVGVVDKAGPGLMGRFLVGKRVVAINQRGGNWAEYAVIPWKQARPLPDDIADDQAATFFVNPVTALAMVRHVLAVPKGEWLLLSAAGSTLGKMIVKLGRRDGFKTLCVVRRSEAKRELIDLGADAVVSSSEGPVPEQVRKITGDDGPRYAIDPIGGEAGTAIYRSLGKGGRLVVYGSLTDEPIQVDPRSLISSRTSVEGFWLGYWMSERSIPGALLLFREVAALIREGVLDADVGKTYPLDQVGEAVREAAAVGRGGKVLLRMSAAGRSAVS